MVLRIVENPDVQSGTEITRFAEAADDAMSSPDDVCVNDCCVDHHRAAEELLREQLCRAQETLASNHEQALMLLSRSLAGGVEAVPVIAGKSNNLPGMPREAFEAPSSCAAWKSHENILPLLQEKTLVEPPPVMLCDRELHPAPPVAAPIAQAVPLEVDQNLELQDSPWSARSGPSVNRTSLQSFAHSEIMPGMPSSIKGVRGASAVTSSKGVNWEDGGRQHQSVLSFRGSYGSSAVGSAALCRFTSDTVGADSGRSARIPSSARPSQFGDYKFEVLPTWGQKDKKRARMLGKRSRSRLDGGRGNTQNRLESRTQEKIDELLWTPKEKKSDRCVMNPCSTKRGGWDLCSLILVTYDMVVIPLSFFDPPDSFFLIFCAWITRLFWTLDVIASFVTGYLKPDGSTEMSFVKIARRYIFTWLLLDLLIVGIDWFEVLMSEMGSMNAARLVKSSRTIRIIRLVRLLRLVRMQTVLQQFAENIQSETMLVVLDIVKMIVLIMGVAHLLACVWYGIGAVDATNTWVQEYKFERLSLGYKYATSLHWSLSQFTGGMDEVTPCNVLERIFVIVVFLFSFIVAAVFVSHITSSMTRLHMITSQQSMQQSDLRKYFVQNKISKRLAARVFRNAKNAVAEKQRFMPESSVELLALVSEPLRVELHFEMFSPILDVHNFFKTYIEECPQVMRKVCHSATKMLAVPPGVLVFNSGEMPSAPMMYFVVSGSLVYTTPSGEVHDVAVGEWLSEGTLWTPWMHRGNLEALTESRLCTIDAKIFQEIVCQFEHSGFDPQERAVQFVLLLNRAEEVTDLDPEMFAVIHTKSNLLDVEEEGHGLHGDTEAAKFMHEVARRASRMFHVVCDSGAHSRRPTVTGEFG